MRSDTELLNWLERGYGGNIIDNIQAIEWKIDHRNLTVRQAIDECIDTEMYAMQEGMEKSQMS